MQIKSTPPAEHACPHTICGYWSSAVAARCGPSVPPKNGEKTQFWQILTFRTLSFDCDAFFELDDHCLSLKMRSQHCKSGGERMVKRPTEKYTLYDWWWWWWVGCSMLLAWWWWRRQKREKSSQQARRLAGWMKQLMRSSGRLKKLGTSHPASIYNNVT